MQNNDSVMKYGLGLALLERSARVADPGSVGLDPDSTRVKKNGPNTPEKSGANPTPTKSNKNHVQILFQI